MLLVFWYGGRLGDGDSIHVAWLYTAHKHMQNDTLTHLTHLDIGLAGRGWAGSLGASFTSYVSILRSQKVQFGLVSSSEARRSVEYQATQQSNISSYGPTPVRSKGSEAGNTMGYGAV